MELSTAISFMETWALLLDNWGCSDIFRTTSVTDSINVQGVSSQSGELSVIYYNARSLIPKIDELRAIAEAKHPDIICIVESWLSDEIQDNELVISNYQLARLDRNRHGGGIIYVRTSLVFDVLFERPSNLELLAISVNSPCSSHKFCIALLYHHPSSGVQSPFFLFGVTQSLTVFYFSTARWF